MLPLLSLLVERYGLFGVSSRLNLHLHFTQPTVKACFAFDTPLTSVNATEA